MKAMVRVKICGLSRDCDIEAAVRARADYAGFVFANSRRRVTPAQALSLREGLGPEITPVGVFVDEAIENIISLVRTGVIDMIQLHGSEDEEYIKELKASTDKAVIKAVALEDEGDAERWEDSVADYLLFDSSRAGSGAGFDWRLTEGVKRPFFLAGGLSPGNIGEAVTKVRPFAVDVSSGVETDGMKDFLKMEEFVRRARSV